MLNVAGKIFPTQVLVFVSFQLAYDHNFTYKFGEKIMFYIKC